MKTGSPVKRLYFWVILLFAVIYFLLMVLPNAAGSDDLSMVMVFEPDEAAPLPFVFDMLRSEQNFVAALKNFITYQYYFYGFPYFAFSALVILPIKLGGALTDQYPAVMLSLRQMASVLPMITAAYLLAQMQTFSRRKWEVAGLFIFLLAVPAVVENNFWWHPDSLTVLAVTATIFFLNRDQLTFGKYFYLAAAACGIAVGIKYTGLYFMLTIPVYLLIGWRQKKISFKKMLLHGFFFVAVMAAVVVISNPLLLFAGPRQEYLRIFRRQSALLREGYNVVYAKGFQAAWPTITEYYGSWVFLLAALTAPVYGILRDRNRLLNVIIVTWAIPLSFFVLTVTHFKYQYWLPVALPVFSSLVVFLPDVQPLFEKKVKTLRNGWAMAALAVMVISAVQFGLFVRTDIERYLDQLNRVETSASINFYTEMTPHLDGLEDQELSVYRDVRLYVPDDSPWDIFWEFQLLSYELFDQEDPAVILLMQQRIRDYLNPDVTGIDPEELETSRIFYRDADEGDIAGYCLVYRNDFGLAFIRDDLCQEYSIE